MPSEMPSKCGVQRAELYTMGNPDGGDQAKSLSPVPATRVSHPARDYHFSAAASGVTPDDTRRQIRSPRVYELIAVTSRK